jgi:protein required for attachment to host cells
MVMNPRSERRRASGMDWLVVANAARARVFERDEGSGALREIADAAHPASKAKESALGRGQPGRVRKGEMSTAFEPRTAPRLRERVLFARELARMLEEAAIAHRMPGLVLLASNPFLGELKARLGPNARALLRAGIASDVTSLQGADLEHRVRQIWAEHVALATEPP